MHAECQAVAKHCATCSEEEVSFNRTLDKGIARFKKAAAAAKSQGQKDIDSKDAFEMWDTYGFPVDLTQVNSVQTHIYQLVSRQQVFNTRVTWYLMCRKVHCAHDCCSCWEAVVAQRGILKVDCFTCLAL